LTPSERIAKCFGDVLDAISLIEAWVEASGGADQAICHDINTRSAIERQLLVIGEAAIRLDRLDQPRRRDWQRAWTGLAFEASATSSGTSMMTSMHRFSLTWSVTG